MRLRGVLIKNVGPEEADRIVRETTQRTGLRYKSYEELSNRIWKIKQEIRLLQKAQAIITDRFTFAGITAYLRIRHSDLKNLQKVARLVTKYGW